MSNEITHNWTSGLTLYFCCFQQDGDVFLTGGASDEVWGTGGRTAADYDEAMTEEATSGHYKGSMAAGIGTGVYQIQIRLRAGAAPADTDIVIGQGEIYWDGTNEVNIYTLSETDVAAIVAKLPTNYIMGSSDQTDKDDEIDAIKAKTDNLPSDPADESLLEAAITAAHSTTDGKIDVIDGIVDAILVDTGTTLENHLTDIKGTGFVKDTDSLVNLAHTGADGDTLETLSDQLDDIKTDTETIIANTGKVVNVYPTGEKKTITGGADVGFVDDEKL